MDARRYLQLSVVVAAATIALKGSAWWLTGSVSLLSDALESLVNLAGAGFGWWMVVVAARPPDDDHPYGHHKAEYFASGFEGCLILIAALAIGWAAIERLRAPIPLQGLGPGLLLSVLGTLLNAGLALAMLRESRRSRSIALEADARHLFTDVWTTVGVIAGLLAVAATGWWWLDPVVAMAVALNIVREGVGLVRRSADGLMDHALEDEVRQQIAATLARHEGASARIDHVVTRRAGQRRFVDLHLHLPAGWTLGRAAAVRGELEQALLDAVPGLRARIELLPTDLEPRIDPAAGDAP